ncbi:hypothetical protein QF035_010466 [Streptomyces umbrinus]|uniref:SRPBCC family protein n=1 Tax=Streptomyces umbrinus TaxID=67370 RepID=A0ABU0TAP1_9ACTN|nr:SRPBCC family protein [Streptomyces umbrinus]MDQ1032884.1 hypothetical protein [Streptomyces umbrinus]
MATATASLDIPQSPARVWQLISGFGSLPDWLPCIPESELSEGGRVRRPTNQDGSAIVERLQAFGHEARSYSYVIEQALFPVTGYLSTLRVHAVPGRPDVSRVAWSGTFTPRRCE